MTVWACYTNEYAKDSAKEKAKNTTILPICHVALLATMGDYLLIRNILT